MRRRDALAFVLATGAAPLALRAQSTKVRRLAWISGSPVAPSDVWNEFLAGMRKYGWDEGKNFTVENLRYGGDSDNQRQNQGRDCSCHEREITSGAGTRDRGSGIGDQGSGPRRAALDP